MSKTKIAIFASGTGSNAKAIIEHSFQANYEVDLIISNKKNAGVLNFSEEFDIDAMVIDKETFYEDDILIHFLQQRDIKYLILAGFLWQIPSYLIQAFPERILNIHPALLPKYGGKGMYGSNVHQAVFDAKEKESGLTIHLVNEEYDKGEILFQTKIEVLATDTPKNIASKILKLEHKHYPQIIEKYIAENSGVLL